MVNLVFILLRWKIRACVGKVDIHSLYTLTCPRDWCGQTPGVKGNLCEDSSDILKRYISSCLHCSLLDTTVRFEEYDI